MASHWWGFLVAVALGGGYVIYSANEDVKRQYPVDRVNVSLLSENRSTQIFLLQGSDLFSPGQRENLQDAIRRCAGDNSHALSIANGDHHICLLTVDRHNPSSSEGKK